MTSPLRRVIPIGALAALLLAAGHASSAVAPADNRADPPAPVPTGRQSEDRLPAGPSSPSSPDPSASTPLPGMPPTPGPTAAKPVNVYGDTTVGHLRPDVAGDKAYVYVPSNDAGTVTEIDQSTMKVVTTFHVGKLVQHVVPSYDLSVLYANASGSNTLVPIDPATGQAGKPIRVEAPYNLYFTPDGQHAVVMAERQKPHRLLRPQDVEAAADGAGPVPGRQPRRLVARRAVLPRHVRVLRPVAPGRHRHRRRLGTIDAAQGLDAPGRAAHAGRARSSTSPT